MTGPFLRRRSGRVTLIVTLFFAALAGPDTFAQVKRAPTEVGVLGMIHSRHRKSKQWGLDQVREAVRRFKPDVLCVELPPDRWGRIWKDFTSRGAFEDDRVKVFPEYTDCLLHLARELKCAVEPCAAWTRKMADARRSRIREFETDPRFAKQRVEYHAKRTEVRQRFEKIRRADDPLVIHSAAYDAAVKAELSVYDKYLNDHIGPGGWTNINRAHMRLIHAAIGRHPGKRILVTFGAGHKYWFLEDLARRKDVRIVDLRPFLGVQAKGDATMRQACVKEVQELHHFFQQWFNGSLPNTEAGFARFAGVLAPDFEIVGPSGTKRDRATILGIVKAARPASAPDDRTKIWTSNESARPLGKGLWLVTYEEWQERGGSKRGRLSSAVLEERPGAANGLIWRHVHEVWLKQE